MTRSRRGAQLRAALCLAASFGLLLGLVERPFWPAVVPKSQKSRAAIAIRDHVIPFQKWGTRHFTRPYLQRHYAAAWYFTQARKDKREAAIVRALSEALTRYPAVDLFLLAHNNSLFLLLYGIPSRLRARLRLVYNTGCRDLTQGRRWLGLGAKSYVGHPGVSASPVFYVYFLRRWVAGLPLNQAVPQSNQRMHGILQVAALFSFGMLHGPSLYKQSKATIYGDSRLDITTLP